MLGLWLNSGDGCSGYWFKLPKPALTYTAVVGGTWLELSTPVVAISARNAQTLYALTAKGGLWKGTLSGDTYLSSVSFGKPRLCSNGVLAAP